MSRKTKRIIGGVVALILVIFCCLYFIPKTTPIDITLDATKYDSVNADRNVIGTVQIHIHGTLKEYLFRRDRIELSIDDFDHLYDIQPWVHSDLFGSPTDFEVNLDVDGYSSIIFKASSTVTGKESAQIHVVFHNNLKKWELFVMDHYFTDEAVKDDPSLNLAYRATIE